MCDWIYEIYFSFSLAGKPDTRIQLCKSKYIYKYQCDSSRHKVLQNIFQQGQMECLKYVISDASSRSIVEAETMDS